MKDYEEMRETLREVAKHERIKGAAIGFLLGVLFTVAMVALALSLGGEL